MWSYRDYSKYGSGGGGPVVIPPEAGNLTGIIITQNPTKTDYIEGESIVLDGLEVTATYDNDVRGIVTGACEIVVNDPLTVTDTSATVSYKGFEASFNINVYAKPLPIPSSALYLCHFNGDGTNSVDSNNNANITYSTFVIGKFGQACNGVSRGNWNANKLASINTVFRYGGYNYTIEFWIKFNSTYSSYNHQFGWGENGRYDDQGLWLDLNTSTKLTLGTPKAGITYNSETSLLGTWLHIAFTIDSSAVITLFVNGKKIGSADSKYNSDFGCVSSYEKSLHWNQPIDELLITNDIQYTSDFTPPGNEYGGKKTLQKIYMEEKPTKTVYQSGETFSLDGAAIKAVFSDGTIMDVTGDCTIVETTPITLSDKFRTILYTYEGVTKKLYINIGAYTIEPTLDLSSTVLLMPFDGSSADLNGHEITNTGDEYYSSIEQGKFDQARYFNGTTDYLSTPYTQDLNIDTGDFTIAFWMKGAYKTTESNMAFVICHHVSSSAVVGVRMGVNADKKLFVLASKDNTGTPLTITDNVITISDNNWTHVAIVRKDNTFSVYIDGKLMDSIEYEGKLYNANTIMIGARINYYNAINAPFQGYIDDLILTKSALWDGEFIPPTKPFSKIS